MRTNLPTSRRLKRASGGRAAVATMAAAVLGVGASLYPSDISSLIGYPPAGRGAQPLDALSPSLYATPRRADITLLRALNLAEWPSDDATLMVQTELFELARIYGSPELVGSLELMQSIQTTLQSRQLVFAGGGGGAQVGTASAETFVEFVVLVENLLKSMAGAAGPELVAMLSNVLPMVMRRLEILIGPPHTSAVSVGAAQAAPLVAPPPPTTQSTTPQAPASRIADPQPQTSAPPHTSAEPTAEALAPPRSESSTPATESVSPTSPAPDITGVVDPPPTPVNPEPSPTASPPPSDEPTAEPDPEPGQDDDSGSANDSTDPDQQTTNGPTSSNTDDSESNSDSTSNSNNSSNDSSGNEQSSSQGNDASNG